MVDNIVRNIMTDNDKKAGTVSYIPKNIPQNSAKQSVWSSYTGEFKTSDDLDPKKNREVQDYITVETPYGKTIAAKNKSKINVVALKGNRSRYVFRKLEDGRVEVTDLRAPNKNNNKFYLKDIDVVRFAQDAGGVYGSANEVDDAQSYFLDTNNLAPGQIPKNAGMIKTQPLLKNMQKSATVTGTDVDDTLYGTYAADKIYGKAGDDVILGNGGNDFIDGGDGADIAVFNINKKNITSLKYDARNKQFKLVYKTEGGTEYTVTLRNIEQLRLLDGTYNLFSNGKPKYDLSTKDTTNDILLEKVEQNSNGTYLNPFG